MGPQGYWFNSFWENTDFFFCVTCVTDLKHHSQKSLFPKKKERKGDHITFNNGAVF